MSDNNCAVSFVIPTLNESENIESTIFAIRDVVSDIPHEIIVVDNGSIDQTVELSNQYADKVLVNTNLTIGGLRNLGSSEAEGHILVFNDADVLLTPEWRKEFDILRSSLMDNRIILGGSLDVPTKNNFLFKAWFMPVLANKSKGKIDYVGSGHMLIRKELFFECGGFDQFLVSGEDYEFCRRSAKQFVEIRFYPKLKTIHLGYPSTLNDFFKRERWHGRGDFQSLYVFLRSKVAIFSVLMLVAHINLLASIFSEDLQLILIALSITLFFPVLFSIVKFPFKLGIKDRFINIFIAYAYLWARSFSWYGRKK